MNPDEEKQNYWEDTDEPRDAFEPTPEPRETEPTNEPVTETSNSQKTSADLPPENPKNPSADATITWTAQEYVHIDKSPIWFILFALVVLGLIAADIFVLKSYTFSALVAVMAAAIIIYTRRPPRELTYALSLKQGLYVGERLYHFDEFKAFGLIKDGDQNSIMLIPRKRFAPGVSVYFPEEAGEKIVDILGNRLPMENLKLDIIDVAVRKLRL